MHMADFFDQLSDQHIAFVERQPVFFVATQRAVRRGPRWNRSLWVGLRPYGIGSGTVKPSLVMRIAVRITGICPSGNSTSTAGPATWITFPITLM